MRLCIWLLAALVSGSVIARGATITVSLSAGDPVGGGPILLCHPNCSQTGTSALSLSSTFSSPDGNTFVYASAGAGYENRSGPTVGSNYTVPKASTAASYQGAYGYAFSGVSATAQFQDMWSLSLAPATVGILPLGDWSSIDVVRMQIVLKDHGVLQVPGRPCWYCGWKTASYDRVFSLNPSLINYLPVPGWNGTSRFSASIGSTLDGWDRLEINELSVLELMFYANAFGTIMQQGEYRIPVTYSMTSSVDVIHFGAPMETAFSNFGNTFEVADWRILDPHGSDITSYFRLTNSDGSDIWNEATQGLAQVPEPTTYVLFLIGLLLSWSLQLKRRSVRRS